MKCPNCKHALSDKTIARHLASKGGLKSKRTISKKQQAAMQEARRKRKQ